jgi:hypothetical protein
MVFSTAPSPCSVYVSAQHSSSETTWLSEKELSRLLVNREGRGLTLRGLGSPFYKCDVWGKPGFVETLVLIVVVVVLVLLLMQGRVSPVGLAVNALVGVVLLILTNLVLSPPIPINVLTVLICAIGGVVGWLILLVLHVLAIAF